ncbi:formylglycine-generating enzyme family protein [Burkholderia orbicola]|uniref:formylglycine-generating enzyme family protein n=1 Tax=Burkholderia orbicola TaxID=2978683 RepID=UPI0026517836|nr:formylglycine-generating enzyme family protein [Burkholderia orbicola]MDN7561088.1 formylglycine-generating enzyme family protein [Burkholderia orbicola]
MKKISLEACVGVLVIFLTAFISHVAMSDAAAWQVKKLDHFRDCDNCSEMVMIPSGEYQMGATEEEFIGQDKKYQFMYAMETPRHTVKIKAFSIAKFHVTRKQFSIFARETGFSGKGCRIFKNGDWEFDLNANWENPGFKQTDSDPVVCVSWGDAQLYIAWVNEKVKPLNKHRYRLPTEEEWEYVARAGTTTPTYWSGNRSEQCKYENARDESAEVLGSDVPAAQCNDGYIWTSPVGSFLPNPWGLYDMLGNAKQWVNDCSDVDYNTPAVSVPNPVTSCRGHILRGASWAAIPFAVRSASRAGNPSDSRNSTNGFRLAVDL